VLVNATRRASDAETAFRQLSLVADRFLNRTLRDAGAIALDHEVQTAGRVARALNASSGPAQRGFHELARRLSAWAPPARQATPRMRPPRAADLAARIATEVAPCA
jgi:hypothetical protein